MGQATLSLAGVVLALRRVFHRERGYALAGQSDQGCLTCGEGATMRLVMRVLLFEFTVSSALLLAGWIRVAVQVWPFAMDSLKAGFGGRTWARAWRAGLGLLVGLPVVAGWPVLLSPVLAKYTSGDWLTIAVLWWVLAGAVGALLLVAKIVESGPRSGPGAGCRCGVCVAHGLPLTPGRDRAAPGVTQRG